MNPTYVRVALYFIAPLLGMLPGVAYNQGAGQIVIDIEAAVVGITGAGVVAAGVFAKWGKR